MPTWANGGCLRWLEKVLKRKLSLGDNFHELWRCLRRRMYPVLELTLTVSWITWPIIRIIVPYRLSSKGNIFGSVLGRMKTLHSIIKNCTSSILINNSMILLKIQKHLLLVGLVFNHRLSWNWRTSRRFRKKHKTKHTVWLNCLGKNLSRAISHMVLSTRTNFISHQHPKTWNYLLEILPCMKWSNCLINYL